MDAQFKASMSSMAQCNTQFTNFGRNFGTLNQGFTQGAAGGQRFNQAVQQNINTLRGGHTTLSHYMNTQRQTPQTTLPASMTQTKTKGNDEIIGSPKGTKTFSFRKKMQGYSKGKPDHLFHPPSREMPPSKNRGGG